MVRAIVRVRVRVMVRVWVRVRLGDAVVINAVGRKVGNHFLYFHFPSITVFLSFLSLFLSSSNSICVLFYNFLYNSI